MHGHEGLVKVFLTEEKDSANIIDTGMVTDFKHLGWLKNFIDDTLDHKFIMDINDPLISDELALLIDKETGKIDKSLLFEMSEGYWIPSIDYISNIFKKLEDDTDSIAKERAIIEKYEGFVLVDFVPTSENLSGWLLKIAQNKMKDLKGVKVQAVEYWETPKSHCRVEA